MTDQWGIPSLRPDRLSSFVPERVYAGGSVTDPAHTLFIWRTARLSRAKGMTVGFYVWDDKLEGLWRTPEQTTARLLTAGVGAVIEPDFSLWRDDPLIVQAYNVYRTRVLGRYWQEHSLPVIPNLNWSDARSFEFSFIGIPQHPPVIAVECRTAGQNDADRRAFLAGLAEGIQQTRPTQVFIYGGVEHQHWLVPRLPAGPRYHLVESFMTARGKVRRQEEWRLRHRNQIALNFLTKGGASWADEAVAAAARVGAQA